MKKDNKNVFTLEDDKGNSREFEVILTVESKEFGKNYIIYTDYTLDENKNYKTYASIYDGEGESLDLTPITTEEEWTMIENVLNSAQRNTLRNEKEDESDK